MKINTTWYKPILLENKKKNEAIIYKINLENIPSSPGCYVFFNDYGNSYTVLYIGKADNLKKRLEQQFNNVKLMMSIKEKSIKGYKKIMFCTIKTMQEEKQKKALSILEKNLIEHAISEGNNLFNIKGTKIQYDEILLKGNNISQKIFGRKINVIKK